MPAPRRHEAVYTLLRLRTRPLLTRHVVYFMIRDQGYSTVKAKQDLDLQPGVTFEQGLERSAAWHSPTRSAQTRDTGTLYPPR